MEWAQDLREFCSSCWLVLQAEFALWLTNFGESGSRVLCVMCTFTSYCLVSNLLMNSDHWSRNATSISCVRFSTNHGVIATFIIEDFQSKSSELVTNFGMVKSAFSSVPTFSSHIEFAECFVLTFTIGGQFTWAIFLSRNQLHETTSLYGLDMGFGK